MCSLWGLQVMSQKYVRIWNIELWWWNCPHKCKGREDLFLQPWGSLPHLTEHTINPSTAFGQALNKETNREKTYSPCNFVFLLPASSSFSPPPCPAQGVASPSQWHVNTYYFTWNLHGQIYIHLFKHLPTSDDNSFPAVTVMFLYSHH